MGVGGHQINHEPIYLDLLDQIDQLLVTVFVGLLLGFYLRVLLLPVIHLDQAALDDVGFAEQLGVEHAEEAA